MLPHVVRWNAEHVGDRYAALLADRAAASPALRESDNASNAAGAGEQLATRLEDLRDAARLPATLRDIGVTRDDFAALAADAATQWTGTCNPRLFDAASALELYERAY
jgi:alcohol dehydrogenase class IV